MKKLFFIVTLCVVGLMSANSTKNLPIVNGVPTLCESYGIVNEKNTNTYINKVMAERIVIQLTVHTTCGEVWSQPVEFLSNPLMKHLWIWLV